LGGVDISPIIWVGICTLLREILLGQQGLITMALK
jgi:YggT family protein